MGLLCANYLSNKQELKGTLVSKLTTVSESQARIEQHRQKLKRAETEIRRLKFREKVRAKKDQENLRYLLGRAVDYGLIVGKLEFGLLEPLVEKHIRKTSDKAFLWQFFLARTETRAQLKPCPLSPFERVISGKTAVCTMSKNERKLIYRRLYHWGVVAEAETWQNEGWFRGLLERCTFHEGDRRFLGLK